MMIRFLRVAGRSFPGVRVVTVLATGFLLSFLLVACPSPAPPPPKVEDVPETPEDTRPLVLDEVGGFALLQLYADGFEALPLQKKLLAYHLYRAAVAGRDIAFDQHHRLSLKVRWILDQILSRGGGVPEETMNRLRKYARLFWMNNGPYFDRTRGKIPVEFSRNEWLSSIGITQAEGGDFSFLGKDIGASLAEIDPLLFDSAYEPWMTRKSVDPGEDLLLASANNFYQGVSTPDLVTFKEKYPLNSRLTKECDRRRRCKLTEEVYRIGIPGRRSKTPPGRYARELGLVVEHLRRAKPFADEQQASRIDALIEYFTTGAPGSMDQADILWLKGDPAVDFILGFIETYKDARGQKGEFEGLIYFRDEENTQVMKGIASLAGYFEANAPWDEAYRKTDPKVTVGAAINVLVGIGGAGPGVPAGINLPNSQALREQYGSRSVLLMNVLTGARRAVADKAVNEFAPPESRGVASRGREGVDRTMIALHEVIGHGSGKVAATLGKDPSEILLETYSALEEARAELVALYFIGDAKLQEIGAVKDAAMAQEVAFGDYLRYDLLQLRRVRSGNRFEDDHMKATHLIVQYLLANQAGAAVIQQDGKTYYQLVDAQAMRRGVGALLAEVMRIKAQGDIQAARKLLADYGESFDTDLRDEVVTRAAQAGLPDFVVFHMPTLRAVTDDAGKVVDVVLDYERSFDSAMLEWDILGP